MLMDCPVTPPHERGAALESGLQPRSPGPVSCRRCCRRPRAVSLRWETSARLSLPFPGLRSGALTDSALRSPLGIHVKGEGMCVLGSLGGSDQRRPFTLRCPECPTPGVTAWVWAEARRGSATSPSRWVLAVIGACRCALSSHSCRSTDPRSPSSLPHAGHLCAVTALQSHRPRATLGQEKNIKWLQLPPFHAPCNEDPDMRALLSQSGPAQKAGDPNPRTGPNRTTGSVFGCEPESP